MINLEALPVSEPLLDTLAEIEAFEQTPLAEQFPYTDSYSMILSGCKRFASDPALEFLLQGLPDEIPITLTYADLAAGITRTSNLLGALGVGISDAVSIILPILPQTHLAIWGSQAAGIANPINPMLEAEHIGEIIEAAESRVVICLGPSPHSDIWEKVSAAVAASSEVRTLIAVQVPGLCHADAGLPEIAGVDCLDFDSAIAKHNADGLDSGRRFSGDQVAAYFHTGGTTGRPKLAQLTHGNMAFLGQLMIMYTAHEERQTVLCGLPLFHIYGCIILGIAAFSVGYRVILMTPAGFRSPTAMPNFWKLIDRFQVKSFPTVPTVLMALNDLPVGDAKLDSLTNVNSGAAPLSQPFKLGFEKKFGVDVANGYGMTETTAAISRAPKNQKPGSVGMRLPYSSIRIAHLEGTAVVKDCELGESGVVLVKGPQVFNGYKSELDNASAWVEDGWFNTGDLGYLDSDGYLFLSGRAKDLIIRSGHNIDPDLIEEPLNGHAEVASATAVGMPDAYTGELPMVFVVRTAGSVITEEELIQFCEKNISERAAIPKRVEFIDAMPLTAVGKIFKPALRERIARDVISEHLKQQGMQATVNATTEKKRGLVLTIELQDKSRIEDARTLLSGYTFVSEVH